MALLEIRATHLLISDTLTANSTLIHSWAPKSAFEQRSLAPNVSGQTIEETLHVVTTEEVIIVATETIQVETVVHSPGKTGEVNDVIILTTTEITTGIVPSATTPISHGVPCAIFVKNLARVEAVNVKAVVTTSNAETEPAADVKRSMTTIGRVLNVKIRTFHSVKNATVVKLPVLVAAEAEPILAPLVGVIVTETAAEAVVAEATVTETAVETVTEAAVAEATVTETAAEAVTEAHLTEAVVATATATAAEAVTEAAVAEATVTATAAEAVTEAHLTEAAVATATATAVEAVTEAHLTEAAETAEVDSEAVVITARPKESVLAMHTTVHLVTCSRASLSAKTRTEGVELLEC